ncbi:LamG domain-containing protein [Polyangium jinanense]|uniref:LamG domain-containing protein n=1 Tax=Polyangium jinanense TaxID=2829994 RepID=A0A9X3XB15_9BACT|nr:LamG domain-containing protein [Polyangium jinanense]MDC3960982.1 LamG domain-containing protein [Polyangium jinanense]MDC3987402.1 LamG domain-containing protein [Polyangium jinanense]
MKTNSIFTALLIGTGLVATACIADPGVADDVGEEYGIEEGRVGEAEEALQIAWPVAAWHFDVNCSGATAFDSSGNDLHGVRSGGVNCAAGAKGGKSLEFNGTNGKVEIPDQAALDFTTAMTVSACVKPQSLASGTILSKWYALDSYQLGVSSGNVLFSVAFPGGQWGVTKDVTAPAATGVWQHVAGVYDGANLLLYRNGALVASTPASGTLQQSSRPVVIGNHPSWSAFNGNIDHVYLYNRALTAAEIGTLKAECLN